MQRSLQMQQGAPGNRILFQLHSRVDPHHTVQRRREPRLVALMHRNNQAPVGRRRRLCPAGQPGTAISRITVAEVRMVGFYRLTDIVGLQTAVREASVREARAANGISVIALSLIGTGGQPAQPGQSAPPHRIAIPQACVQGTQQDGFIKMFGLIGHTADRHHIRQPLPEFAQPRPCQGRFARLRWPQYREYTHPSWSFPQPDGYPVGRTNACPVRLCYLMLLLPHGARWIAQIR